MSFDKILHSPVSAEGETSWEFNGIPIPPDKPPKDKGTKRIYGKLVSFTHERITLQWRAEYPSNRILHEDDPRKFVLVSFGGFRFPDTKPSITTDYIRKFMEMGLVLNGVRYRFYGHSNSQLRGRSCFLREGTEVELDNRINSFGNFASIRDVAKRAKRIGLMFSEAALDWTLDPKYTEDIDDLKTADGQKEFSDGCGLISPRFSKLLSKEKRIIFHEARYRPSVYQIRYRGYKGVLMEHPDLDKQVLQKPDSGKGKGKESPTDQPSGAEPTAKKFPISVQFRGSMKKFKATSNNTFSVVEHSMPYKFGRLNNDIIVLLSALGVSNEALLKKQQEYFDWIVAASTEPTAALDLLSCMDRYDLVKRLLLDGFDTREVQDGIRAVQSKEINSFLHEVTAKPKSRMIIKKSRLLFGVCDPYQILRDGEVFVRIMEGRKSIRTLSSGDVMVVRNPCLHPGDILKLRTVNCEKLNHLVDCVVFASVGKRPAPEMTSGGDLDGDMFLVCWDPDIVPAIEAESYDYPAPKPKPPRDASRKDLAMHFASYNSSSVAKVAALHLKWAKAAPKGAMSPQCQELNALHSLSVDGGKISIPERLKTPPEAQKPFILDLLAVNAASFTQSFAQGNQMDIVAALTPEDGDDVLHRVLTSDASSGLTEFEIFCFLLEYSRKRNDIDIYRYIPHIDFSALTAAQKHIILSTVTLTPAEHPYVWNSLIRSDVLKPRDLDDRGLRGPLKLQRLYSSRIQGRGAFFEYLKVAVEDFTRKLIIIKTDERFAAGVFIRGKLLWDDEPGLDKYDVHDNEVNDDVSVCSFQPTASTLMSHYRRTTKGYRIHCTDGLFQLYDVQKANSFVFVNRPPPNSGKDIAVSIALQKIDQRVSQIGRLNRAEATTIEIHVVSNRDREAHRVFDLRFEHKETTEKMKRFGGEKQDYTRPTIKTVNWDDVPNNTFKELFTSRLDTAQFRNRVAAKPDAELDELMHFAIRHHAVDQIYDIFEVAIDRAPIDVDRVGAWLDNCPLLVYPLLKLCLPDPPTSLLPPYNELTEHILRSVILSANEARAPALVALEKLASVLAEIPLELYLDLLWLAALSVRSPQLVQEVIIVLDERRSCVSETSKGMAYAHHHAKAIAIDRAEEAAQTCPCGENGVPLRQKTSPIQTPLLAIPSKPKAVKVHIRVDSTPGIRLHSHVRLKEAGTPTNALDRRVMDGIVTQSARGEATIEVLHPLPADFDKHDWLLYNAGSIATSRAMLDAVRKLAVERENACVLYGLITDAMAWTEVETVAAEHAEAPTNAADEVGPSTIRVIPTHFNESQRSAIESISSPLSLIWGPPGTGKTTVVVEILHQIISSAEEGSKILMTASTHNAVDNVLERFAETTSLSRDQILRAATDFGKVNKKLLEFTIDARLGGSPTDDPKLIKQAKKRMGEATIVFTTCAGAGLGVLRDFNFDIVLIDEASQVTEPCALIPLAKGCSRAVMVGDHVQLRPNVQRLGKVFENDISMLERLYKAEPKEGISKTMLDTQYRFPEALAHFPSEAFYEGRLRTGTIIDPEVDLRFTASNFPWPMRGGRVFPNVFVQCSTEEEYGGSSKENVGQADLVCRIVELLRQNSDPNKFKPFDITVLSPYKLQIKNLGSRLPSTVPASTIDAFQGRESDIIVFCTVRSNASGDLGFLDDDRRLNVAWTRARFGRIVVGDKETLKTSKRWLSAVEDCIQVDIPAPIEK